MGDMGAMGDMAGVDGAGGAAVNSSFAGEMVENNDEFAIEDTLDEPVYETIVSFRISNPFLPSFLLLLLHAASFVTEGALGEHVPETFVSFHNHILPTLSPN